MLTKNIFQTLSAIFIVCFTSACVTPMALADSKCAEKVGNKRVKLTVAEYQLGLDTKKSFCVEIDKAYIIPIKIPGYSDHIVAAGDVTVAQKTGSPFIISGSNLDDPKYLKIMVKNFTADAGDENNCGDESEDECAGFWIKVKGVGKLDPRVRVVDSTFAMGFLQSTFAEFLTELNLTAEEASILLAAAHGGK